MQEEPTDPPVTPEGRDIHGHGGYCCAEPGDCSGYGLCDGAEGGCHCDEWHMGAQCESWKIPFRIAWKLALWCAHCPATQAANLSSLS